MLRMTDGSNLDTNPDMGPIHSALDAADDVHCVLAAGEPAMVFLERAGNTALRKPADGIIVGECLHGTFHHSFPAGVGIGE